MLRLLDQVRAQFRSAPRRDKPEGDLRTARAQVLNDAVQFLPEIAIGYRLPGLPRRRLPAPADPPREPLRRAESDVLQIGRNHDATPALTMPGAELEGGDHGAELGPVARGVEGLAAGAPVLQPEADCAVGVVVAPVEGKQRTSTSAAAAAVGRPTTTTSPRTFVFEAAPALSRDVLSPIVQTAPIDYDEDLAAVVAVHEPRLLCPREDGL